MNPKTFDLTAAVRPEQYLLIETLYRNYRIFIMDLQAKSLTGIAS